MKIHLGSLGYPTCSQLIILTSKSITDEIGYTILSQPSDLLEDLYLQNVKFYEGWTESQSQITSTAGAMSDLGIESSMQYFSLALSLTTLTKCLAERVSYLKHNQEPKLFSIDFLIDLLEVIVIFGLCFLAFVFLILTNSATTPIWLSFIMLGIFFYAIVWFTLMRFTRFISNMLLYHLFAIYWILLFGLNYLFHFVSFIQ